MTLDGYAVLEKKADKGGNSGRVYVPKSWIGRRVRIVLMEYEDPDNGPRPRTRRKKTITKVMQ